ncbi:retrotransposon protein, putative, ty1-copia subclass [Tanacetum coccineum]
MHVIEQPLPPAPEPVAEPDIVAQWTALYDAHTEITCLMLGSMTPKLHRQFELYHPFDMIQELRYMFEKQAGVEKFDLIQSFHACKQVEGKPVADYVLKMKGYVEILERLGYVLLQDIIVVLIFNGLTKDFVGFSGNNPEGQKKSLNAKGNNKVKGKGNDKKVYIPKPKNPTPSAWRAPSKDVLLPPTVRGRSTGKGSCPAIRSDRGGKYISQEFKDCLKADGIVQQLTPLYTPQHNGVFERRNRTLLDMMRSMMNLTTLPLSFWDYALEFATRILNMDPTKRNQWEGVDLEEIQEEEDTTPSEITSNIPQKVEGFEPPQPPQEEVILIRRRVGKSEEYVTKVIAKDGTVTRFEGRFPHFIEEEEEKKPKPYNLYGFVDLMENEQVYAKNGFSPHRIPQPEGNHNGWLSKEE